MRRVAVIAARLATPIASRGRHQPVIAGAAYQPPQNDDGHLNAVSKNFLRVARRAHSALNISGRCGIDGLLALCQRRRLPRLKSVKAGHRSRSPRWSV